MISAHVKESVEYIREHAKLTPTIAIVLGSGLGDFADELPGRIVLSTSDIPHFPLSTVEGHKGQLVFALLGKKSILAFQGRTHFYESNSLDTVLYPIHLANQLGIKSLIVTNAAGGLNRTFRNGDLMILTDQINFTFARLLRHPVRESGSANMYTPHLINKAERAAATNGIVVRKGVYFGLKGPSYETVSEVEMCARLGGDAVGMSTVFEASLASSLGMEVLGISCITNLATGISPTKLNHAEVTEVGNRVKQTFAKLVSSTIELM